MQLLKKKKILIYNIKIDKSVQASGSIIDQTNFTNKPLPQKDIKLKRKVSRQIKGGKGGKSRKEDLKFNHIYSEGCLEVVVVVVRG